MTQSQMGKLANGLRRGTWTVVTALIGLHAGGPISAFLSSIIGSTVDIAGAYADASGTTLNDVTVRFYKGEGFVGAQVFRGHEGLWVAVDPFFFRTDWQQP